MKRRQLLVLLSFASVALASACTSSALTSSPNAPSQTGSTTSTGATVTTAASITGTVSRLTGACPVVSFALEGKTITTAGATTYSGGECGGVKNAVRVTVSGMTQADGGVIAANVTFPAVTPTPAPTPAPITITGTVSRLAGACPAVSFTLEGKTILAGGSTTYEGGGCADVGNAVRVTTTGTTQADGSVLAQRIAIVR